MANIIDLKKYLRGTSMSGITRQSIAETLKADRTPTLQASVEDALRAYFHQLGNTPTTHLHALVLSEIEPPLIKAVLKHTGFNRLQAAKQLGMSRTTFHKKLKQYDLDLWIHVTKREQQAASLPQSDTSEAAAVSATEAEDV